MQRAARRAGASFVVQPGRDRDGVRIGLNHRMEQRIERGDSPQVRQGQLPAGQLARGHQRLELRDRGLDEDFVCQQRAGAQKRREPTTQQCRTARRGRADEPPARYRMILIRTTRAPGVHNDPPVSFREEGKRDLSLGGLCELGTIGTGNSDLTFELSGSLHRFRCTQQ